MNDKFVDFVRLTVHGNDTGKFYYTGILFVSWLCVLLRKGFHQVKVKYGSNQLAKVWADDGLSLHNFFGYCQHMIKLNNLQN